MAHKILNTPDGIGQIPAGNVLVGNGYTGNLVTFNGKIFVFDFENTPDPYNPLNLPPNTIRVKFSSGYTPDMGDTQTLVDATNNVWDIEKTSENWNSLFNESLELLEVLGANTKNVTSMISLFHYCTSLTNVALFDTSNVTVFKYVFEECTSLTSIPLFDTSKMVDVECCFHNCYSVNTGILDLYNRMINQSNPPTSYNYCFSVCGIYSTTGAAELAQIPSGWR